MRHRILVTGSSGLVGAAICSALASLNCKTMGLDTRAVGAEHGDIRDEARVAEALADCDGIVHLAAVSRVADAERDPDLCWSTNVQGLRVVVTAALSSPRRPWVLFASSREVYGNPERLPVMEEAPLRPVNTYGRSKAEGERLIQAAQREGLRAVIVRLANVYGTWNDHPDRVIPAFVRAATANQPLHVNGADHTFDFTHLDDVVAGLVAVTRRLLAGGEPLPSIHLASGVPTSLLDLARTAIEVAASQSTIQVAPPRTFDVSSFVGCPERARTLLGWSAQVSVRDGLRHLIHTLRAAGPKAEEATT